jgi:chromosome segregation ATPase
MAHNILSKINASKSRAEAAEIGITDRVYQAMMEDARDEIRTKAMGEARMAVQGELSAAQTATNTAKTEAARIETKLAQAEAMVAKAEAKLAGSRQAVLNLEKERKSLEKIVKLEQGTLTAKDLEYKSEIKALKDELKKVSSQRRELELANAKLQGQITATPKVVKTKKAPRKMPEFTIEDVVRGGPENRIVGATIKPRLK